MEDEITWIADTAKQLTSEGKPLSDCCVLLRVKRLRDKYAKALKKAGFEVVTLDAKNDNRAIEGIRIANMHRIKGLEFRHVFLAGMSEETVPFKKAVEGSEDPTELRDYELGERALIHVASSRAIETLHVSWHGKPSTYLNLH